MKPGMRENECVALVNRVLFELGSEHVEGVNAISGERCSPHPHVFTDRMLRPGDPAYFDILHAFNGYRTCYYRTFAVGSASRAQVDAYKRCRDILDQAIALDPAGCDDGGRRLDLARGRRSSASRTRRPRSRSSTGTASASRSGRSRSSAASSRSTTRRRSRQGMVFALETFWPASDGWSAARIEEQLVVTEDGCEVITRFPAEELLVAGGGPLHGRRAAARRSARPSRTRTAKARSTGSSPARTARALGT